MARIVAFLLLTSASGILAQSKPLAYEVQGHGSLLRHHTAPEVAQHNHYNGASRRPDGHSAGSIASAKTAPATGPAKATLAKSSPDQGPLVLTFQHGHDLGLSVDTKTGEVKAVDETGQGKKMGVTVGMYMQKLDDQDFTVDILKTMASGKVDYTAVFQDPAVFTFTAPGALGLHIAETSGKVETVDDGQGKTKGVEVGMILRKLDDDELEISDLLAKLTEKEGGTGDYNLTFERTAAQTLDPTPAPTPAPMPAPTPAPANTPACDTETNIADCFGNGCTWSGGACVEDSVGTDTAGGHTSADKDALPTLVKHKDMCLDMENRSVQVQGVSEEVEHLVLSQCPHPLYITMAGSAQGSPNKHMWFKMPKASDGTVKMEIAEILYVEFDSHAKLDLELHDDGKVKTVTQGGLGEKAGVEVGMYMRKINGLHYTTARIQDGQSSNQAAYNVEFEKVEATDEKKCLIVKGSPPTHIGVELCSETATPKVAAMTFRHEVSPTTKQSMFWHDSTDASGVPTTKCLGFAHGNVDDMNVAHGAVDDLVVLSDSCPFWKVAE